MLRCDRLFDRLDRCGTLLAFGVAVAAHVPVARADEPAFRFDAPIVVQRSAPFAELALPAAAYARSRAQGGDGASGLRDLRIVDSRNERVPFAWLAPRAGESRASESLRDAVLYPLPPRPAADGSWRSPIDIVVEGERINVRRLAARGSTTTDGGPRSGGWLIDLGERKPALPSPDQLRLVWSGPNEFSAAFDIATSDDLRNWRARGAGQVLALQSASGALTQPNVLLPASGGRFVRLVWADAATAPAVTGAKAVTTQRDTVALDAPTELSFEGMPSAKDTKETNTAAVRGVDFDLGGPLPIAGIDLQWTSGTHVAPVRAWGRTRTDEAWRELGSAVFYRLDRQGAVSTSPTWALRTNVRYLRLVPDERAAALDAAQVRLRLQAELAHLVFATQGQPPYRVLVGSADASAAALPIAALVPSLADERSRFGSAAVGDWSEIAAAAKRDDAKQREAALRPWLLWAVLIGGVAVLAFMVWRLTRGTPGAA
jgi:hypothetical protein